MTCPRCGARNPPEAAWCTQCYTRFGGEGGADAPAADARDDTAAGAVGGRTARTTTGSAATADRGVREHDGIVEWRCSTCGAWNPLLGHVCATCGTARRGFGEAVPPRRGDAGVLVVPSLLLPGLGHVLAGHVGTGVARAVLSLLWGVGGLAIVLGDGSRSTPGWVLLGGAAVLWAVTLLDARRLTTGREGELLDTRRLLGLVVLVTGLLVAAAVVTSPTVSG